MRACAIASFSWRPSCSPRWACIACFPACWSIPDPRSHHARQRNQRCRRSSSTVQLPDHPTTELYDDPTMNRDRVTWLAYLMLAFYGYFLNVFGPIAPYLKSELNLSYTVSSFHFSAFALGMICAGLIGHSLIQTTGRWNALWISAFGVSLGSLLLIAGRSALLTIGASFFMGLVGSLVLTVVPSVLADQHGEL